MIVHHPAKFACKLEARHFSFTTLFQVEHNTDLILLIEIISNPLVPTKEEKKKIRFRA